MLEYTPLQPRNVNFEITQKHTAKLQFTELSELLEHPMVRDTRGLFIAGPGLLGLNHLRTEGSQHIYALNVWCPLGTSSGHLVGELRGTDDEINAIARQMAQEAEDKHPVEPKPKSQPLVPKRFRFEPHKRARQIPGVTRQQLSPVEFHTVEELLAHPLIQHAMQYKGSYAYLKDSCAGTDRYELFVGAAGSIYTYFLGYIHGPHFDLEPLFWELRDHEQRMLAEWAMLQGRYPATPWRREELARQLGAIRGFCDTLERWFDQSFFSRWAYRKQAKDDQQTQSDLRNMVADEVRKLLGMLPATTVSSPPAGPQPADDPIGVTVAKNLLRSLSPAARREVLQAFIDDCYAAIDTYGKRLYQ